jgi:hypothetical protein
VKAALLSAITAIAICVACDSIAGDSPPKVSTRSPRVSERARDRASAIAVVRASLGAGGRDFAYVDRITPALRPYRLYAAPIASIDGEIAPLAREGVPALEGFGVTFDYARAFALSSADASGTPVGTSWSAFDVGARERVRIGRAVLAGLHGGYGAIAYAFDDALGVNAVLPAVDYRFVRAGADLRVTMGPASLYASGSYLAVLSTGTVGVLFPRATVGGADARVGLAWMVARGLEASIEIDYTRFWYALRPAPGDVHVAGGALDQMGRAGLGVAYLF